jgi:hypothetical protein
MELAKLVLEFVKALAWPVAALVIALIFRREIRAIIARIRKAALPGGVSIDFEEQILETKELATRIEATLPPPNRPQTAVVPLTEANSRMISLGLKPAPSGLDLSYYRSIAARDPTLALAGLRIELEILIRNLAKGFKIEVPPHESPSRVLRRLLDASAITEDQFALGKQVLSLANQAVHGRAVSHREAEEIIEVAQVLVDDYRAWLSWGFDDGWESSNKEVVNRPGISPA